MTDFSKTDPYPVRGAWRGLRGAELTIRSRDDLEGILRAGRVVRSALSAMRKTVRPGVTTQALDDICADVFEKHGARSGPNSYTGFRELHVSASTRRRCTAFPGTRGQSETGTL